MSDSKKPGKILDDAKLEAEWVDALRSGKYEQGSGQLLSANDRRYCCLGVLVDIAGCQADEFGQYEFIPDMDGYPYIPKEKQRKLSILNDGDFPTEPLTFAEIADRIEKGEV